jgi:MFS family permease
LNTANPVSSSDTRDPLYGWLMVFIVFTLSVLAFGALGSISVVLKPLSTEFGWSRAETSLGYTVIAFSTATFGILWGYIADKYGTRWFGVVAAFAMSGSLFLLSKQSSLLQFYSFYFVFGAFGAGLATSPLFANVGFWFRKNPGLAIGITAAGGAVGQGIVPYLVAMSISANGWRSTYLIMAVAYICIALPLALLIRESPWRKEVMQSGQDSNRDFPLSEVEVIAWISIAVIFCCNCMSMPIVHLIPLLTDAGRSVEVASSVFLLLMLSGGLGRIMGGKLGDWIGALPTYMVMSLGQTFFVVWFPHIDSLPLLYFNAVFFGFTYSGVMSSLLMCTRMMVGARLAARAMSLTSFFGWIGMGMGGFIGGIMYDTYSNYIWSFSFASIMGTINLLILSLFYLRIRSKRKTNMHSALPAKQSTVRDPLVAE